MPADNRLKHEATRAHIVLGADGWLTLLAVVCSMVSPRSLVIILLFVAVFLLSSMYRQDRKFVVSNFHLNGKVVWAALLLLVWAGMSLGWTLDAGGAFNQWLKVLALITAGAFCLSGQDGYCGQTTEASWARIEVGFLVGCLIGWIAILVAYCYAQLIGDSLWGGYYFDPLTPLNNSAVIMALFGWPLGLIGFRRYGRMFVGAFVAWCSLIFLLSSLAASGSLLIGLVAMAIRLFGGRALGQAMALLVALSVMAGPQLAHDNVRVVLRQFIPDIVTDVLPYSAEHRLLMWSFAANRISEKTMTGWGFFASRHIPQEKARVSSNMEVMPLHPHNMIVQIQLELGVIGSIFLAALFYFVVVRVSVREVENWCGVVQTGVFFAWLFIACLSYGAWQSWWIATAFMLAILMRAVLRSASASKFRP